MRGLRLLFWLPLFVTLTACPPSGKDSDDTGSEADADADADTDADTDTDTDNGDEGPSYCVQSCTSNADCELGSQAFDADNYDCNEGACTYTGCNSDAECESWIPGYVCVGDATGMASCLQGCTTNADCDLGVAAYDADNYECTSGGCTYSGCNSDAECESWLAGFVCAEDATGMASCVPGCTSNAECDLGSAAYDADNYECNGGGCIYSGCNSNEECESEEAGLICH